MKITEHLYKISGVEYGTNSNMYAVQYSDGLILIDAGFQNVQFERAAAVLDKWGLSIKNVTHVFLTHSHYDHAGNVKRFNEMGIQVLSSDYDKVKIEHDYPEMEKLFNVPWTIGKVDKTLDDGQKFVFPGGVILTAIATPGHNPGSMSYVIEVDGERALATGDMFWTIPKPPEDALDIELGFMGSEDFCMDSFVDSLQKVSRISASILLPGHYYFYKGNEVKELCILAYRKAATIQEKQY